jgi:putative transcriptional regulator
MENKEDDFKIKHNNINPEKGRILIAEPFMRDLYFQRSVVLLTEHTSEGSMGFVVNKRMNMYVNSFIEPFKKLPLIPVFLGGPVGFDRLLYVHTLGRQIADSIEIADSLFFSGDFESIVYHLLGDPSNTGKIKFFIGYSGWTANQLQNEIENDSWLVSNPLNNSDIISAEDGAFWKQSVENVGGQYLKWLNYPRNPLLN